MPYPAQTDRTAIVQTARELIEREGIEQLALGRLASELHIKAPSLYRHVASKDALIQAIVTETFQDLFSAYAAALQAASGEPIEQLHAIFRAHRAFAQANPAAYMLAFTTTAPAQRADERALEQLAVPIQGLISAISGETRSLAALRGALALTHGFAMLEINEQLRRGGDLDAAFEQSVAAYLAGWQQR